MPTVSDLIHSSFRLIGAIAAGETLETNELNDALVSLNQMVESWNTEGASVFSRERLLISIAGTQMPYTLAVRPIRIESASTTINGIDNPLEIVDSTGWEAIDEKGVAAIRTQKLYCDYQYPTSNVYIWPLPRNPGSLEMWVYVPLQEFTALTDEVSLPTGYEIAIRFNFAVALLPEYPRSQMDPMLPAQAQNYKASIVQLNAQNLLRSQMGSAAQSAISDTAQTAAR